MSSSSNHVPLRVEFAFRLRLVAVAERIVEQSSDVLHRERTDDGFVYIHFGCLSFAHEARQFEERAAYHVHVDACGESA